MNGERGSIFIIDSWSWIEYLDGSKTGERIKPFVESEKNNIVTSAISLCEVVSRFLRKHMDPQEAVRGISNLSNILPVDQDIAVIAGELHAEIKQKIKDFGIADALILSTARKYNAKIITGDPHFKGFKEAIII